MKEVDSGLRQACQSTIINARKNGETSKLPLIFQQAEKRIGRARPDECGGRYARYFKFAPEQEQAA